MDVTPLIRPDLNIIQSYNDGIIKITGKHYKVPIAVTCDAVYALEFENGLTDPTQISFLSDDAHIILVGYKNGFMPVAPYIQQKFRDVGMTVDAMDYGAAARTYNVLATEGRPVAVLFF